VGRYGIDCHFERTGEIDVAVQPHQVEELRSLSRVAATLGLELSFLDRDAVQAEVHSPTFLAGIQDSTGVAMLNPARLAWGLKRACQERGIRIYEHTRASELSSRGPGVAVRTSYGRVFARQAALGLGAFPSLVRRVRPYVVSVYDYALMTEPLTERQRESVGWRNRQGLADSSHHFHYFRLTAENRILWGGYDVIYHYGSRIAREYDQRPATHALLAAHFFRCFPQLTGLRFTHTWGGVIDTCSRSSPFFGTAHGGRVVYAAGYTGLGVGATRFGAEVMLDLLAGERTERTGLEMVRRKPLPFPPEPFAWTGIALTKWSLARADAYGGRRNLWLRTMDRLGLGFDS
jgi:glycine/D-amino acid oxidase-like deaminating enzyme